MASLQDFISFRSVSLATLRKNTQHFAVKRQKFSNSQKLARRSKGHVETSNDKAHSRSVEVTTMQVRWKRLLLQSTVWLFAEVILTCIGFDDIADYGEYHITSKQAAIAQLMQAAPLA